jgi:phage-related protein
VWEKIKGFAGALGGLITGWFEDLSSFGGKVISWIASGATGLAGKIWDNISGFANALWDKILGLKDDLTGFGTKMIGWISAGISAAADGIASAAKGIVNKAIDFINGAIDKINTVKDWVNNINPGPDIPNIPRIPRLAQGGIVMRPTLALIGEAGPEAVVPLRGRSGMGQTININIEAGLVSTPDQIGQQIIEAIQRAQRRSGPVFAPA